jgi:hypothetical protein
MSRQLQLMTVGLLSALVLIINPSASHAQGGIDRERGVREPARTADRLQVESPGQVGRIPAAAAEPPRHTFLLIPGIVFADGANVYGASLGYINRTLFKDRALQAKVGYKVTDFEAEEAESSDKFTAQLKVGLLRADTKVLGIPTAMSLVEDFGRTPERATTNDLALASEFTVLPKLNLAAGVNVSYTLVSPDEGESVSDVTILPGIVWGGIPSTELSADYEFKNDVNGEDNWSFSVYRALFKKRVSGNALLGVAKHGTVFANLIFVL